MNIPDLPFNTHTGIQPATTDGHLLRLPFADHLMNHVGTLHASAIYALAEASSGEFLVQHLGDEQLAAVVRKATAKYSAPAESSIVSRAATDPQEISRALTTVQERGRSLLTIEIEILHESDRQRIGRFSFEWFLAESKRP